MLRYAIATLLAVSPLCGVVSAGEPVSESAPSFLNDVVPILTKQGCNQGACHGKGAGQNGFRLSLRGYAPELDHAWITKEFSGRRVDPAVPQQSLLLTKATADAPHEGGKLFAVGSREYTTLLAWLRAGRPGPNSKDPTIQKLEVTPADKVLKVGDRLPLQAWATFSDGSRRDVTWLTKFESNDTAVADVASSGLVSARRNGATAIRAAFQTEVAVATVAVPFEQPVDAKRFEAGNNLIDLPLFAKLKDLRIEPSDACTDEEFLRRAFLDTIGTLPTPAETAKFLADGDAKKREKLVDSLLARPEFVDYWTLFLSDLLQNRKERDHDVRGTKGVRQFHGWIRKQVAANRPWDQIAREVLTATGKTTENPAVGYFVVTVGEHREVEKSEAAESVAQAFLGTRIGCTRCHNHPLERYTQDDFYHFSAFFTRVKLERKDPRTAPTTLVVSHHDKNQNKNPVQVRQPRTGAMLRPQPLDRTTPDVKPTEDPREKLADWIVDPKNEAFSGAMVNRLWKHFFAVGLVEPVDDIRATNPPSNPALWAALNREFVAKKYDLKHLIRTILLSRAYQLTSATRPGNEADSRFYSHYYARRLPAEVLLDAICQATGVPEEFAGYPAGVRALQIPDSGVNSYFLTLFGRSPRVTACACERMGDVTMPQLLHLQNGDRLAAKMTNPAGTLAKLLKEQNDDGKLTEELFLRTMARLPRPDEREAVSKALQSGDPRDEVFRDVFWALLNSKSFAFNH